MERLKEFVFGKVNKDEFTYYIVPTCWNYYCCSERLFKKDKDKIIYEYKNYGHLSEWRRMTPLFRIPYNAEIITKEEAFLRLL